MVIIKTVKIKQFTNHLQYHHHLILFQITILAVLALIQMHAIATIKLY